MQTTQFNSDVLYESQIYINNNLSNGAQDDQGSRKTIVSLFDSVRSCPFGIPGDDQTPRGPRAFARILILRRPGCSSSTVYLCLIFSILAIFYILYFTEAYKPLLALFKIDYANGQAEHGQPGHV